MPRPPISVVLPFRDAAATLAEALASTLADLGPDDEIVAVDDGSRDEGPRLVEDAHRVDARVRLVPRADPRGSVAGALRLGVARARHAFIGRMDGDDVTLRGRFDASFELLASDPSLGAVAVRAEGFPAPDAGLTAYLAWQNALLAREAHAHAIFVESPLCHPATLLRREALDAVGGYQDPPWPEDWDLWLRMHARGYGLAKVPATGLRWRRHAAAVTLVDPRCTRESLREARATYLARELSRRGRDFAVWGAGKEGRRLARSLAARGARPTCFVDIDPLKIGRVARGLPIVSAEVATKRARDEALLVVIAVGARGARDVVRTRLLGAGLVEGEDFLAAA